MRVYLDTCCLNRPFDDQRQPRIHLEAEAVLLIVLYAEIGSIEWIGSDVLVDEIARNSDAARREMVQGLASGAHQIVGLDKSVLLRGREIERMGFGGYDALHVSSAERGRAEMLLTTDDKFIKLYERNQRRIKVKIRNPLVWVQEAKL